MRVGISGAHGTGKTTLVEALCRHLPDHVAVDEPYYLLEEQGYEFQLPPSLEDYRALLACAVRSLSSPLSRSGTVFDRTPLDYLAYMAATGSDPLEEVDGATLRPAFARLDLLVGFVEAGLPGAGWRQGVGLSVVVDLVLCGRHVADEAVQAGVVVPGDPLVDGDLSLSAGPPRPAPLDQLGLERPVDRLGHRVVVRVGHRADRGHDSDIGKPCGVTN